MKEKTEHRPSRPHLLGPVLVLVVLGAIGTFVWNAVETSTARVSATTESSALFSAGSVDLAQPFTEVDLVFDASNLYPGIQLNGCVEVQYGGSIPADVRLHARTLAGTGLEEFVDLQVDMVAAASCAEAIGPTRRVYENTLAGLARRHPGYPDGVRLTTMESRDTIVLVVAAELQDDNAAQGLTTRFSLTVEARP